MLKYAVSELGWTSEQFWWSSPLQLQWATKHRETQLHHLYQAAAMSSFSPKDTMKSVDKIFGTKKGNGSAPKATTGNKALPMENDLDRLKRDLARHKKRGNDDPIFTTTDGRTYNTRERIALLEAGSDGN